MSSHSFQSLIVAAFISAAVVAPSPAYAQDAAASPSSSPAPTQTATPPAAPTVVTRWNNGLSIESTDGNNKLQLGAQLQLDGRFTDNDPSPIVDTFLLRRARVVLQGRMSKYFEFYFVPDFAGSAVTLFDAYVDTKFSDAFRIRAGKSKTPVGLELLYSDAATPFVERSLATNLAPNRDVGVTALGDLFKGHLSYIGGVVNGVPDAANGDTDVNNGKDLVGRATVLVGPAGFAIGGTHGKETGALPSFKSTAQQTFFSYGTGVTANGKRNRVSPSAFVYYRAVGGFAEYFHTTQAILKGSATNDLANTGWNATGIVVLTGETASDRGVTPAHPFDPANGHWGALQLAVRVSSLTVDPRAGTLSLAASGTSLSAKAVGLGIVWYNTANVKHALTFERTVFDGDAHGPRKAENAIVFRVQINLAPSL